MAFPKWMYRKDPHTDAFQSTLVGNAQAESELAAAGWNEDPHSHGVEVVPYPAELSPGGTLMHHQTQADANGNHPYGPPPTAPGIGGKVSIGQ